MRRYSNQYLNNIVPGVDLADDKNISRKELERFNELLASMLNALAKRAANSEHKKFAAEEVNFTNAETLYGLVECTPELTLFECNMCFQSAIAFVPTYCDGKRGARVLLAGCNIRYELYPFYNVTATLTPPVGRTRSSGRSHASVVLSFVIPIVASVLLFVLGLYSFVGKQARSMVLSWKKTVKMIFFYFFQCIIFLSYKSVMELSLVMVTTSPQWQSGTWHDSRIRQLTESLRQAAFFLTSYHANTRTL